MNATMKKLYNVLVVGGTLAAAACDRPAQRPATTPSPDAAATTDAPAEPDAAPAPDAPAPDATATPATTAPAPAAGGVRGWWGG